MNQLSTRRILVEYVFNDVIRPVIVEVAYGFRPHRVPVILNKILAMSSIAILPSFPAAGLTQKDWPT